uniref:Reverse transcriptase domain-containing protein n=1 Tax=Tanacetum cinerariifolium TaxID=118510 RepID=A0A6L2K5B0_TANCI|nr:hypothetical protein [Tanacetum cinerariifolium]
MFKRFRDFIRGKVATGSVEMVRPSQGDKGYIRLAWSGGPEKARNKGGLRETQRNMGIYTSYPRKDAFTLFIKTLKEMAMESVSFLEPPPLIGTPKKQNLLQWGQGSQHQRLLSVKKTNRGSCGLREVGLPGKGHPLKQPAKQESRKEQRKSHKHDKEMGKSQKTFYGRKVRILVDGESSSEIMYEHCFKNLSINIQSRLRRCRALLIGFSGETYHPFGIIDLRVTMEKKSKEALWECRQLERVQCSWKEVQWRQREEKMSRIREQAILRTKSSFGHMPNQGLVPLKKHGSRKTQKIYSPSAKKVFAWAGLERTVIPRFVMEHLLKIYPLAESVVHKRRPLTLDERQALTERVFGWLKEGTLIKVQHPEWVSNTIPIKLANKTWKVQVDYSSLNKVYAKDMFCFSEEGEELESLMEYPYKCRRIPPKVKKKIENFQTLAIPKKGEADAMHVTEKWDDKLRSNGRKGRNPRACLIYEPTVTWNEDMLHPYGKNDASFNSHNMIPEDNLQNTRGGSDNR